MSDQDFRQNPLLDADPAVEPLPGQLDLFEDGSQFSLESGSATDSKTAMRRPASPTPAGESPLVDPSRSNMIHFGRGDL